MHYSPRIWPERDPELRLIFLSLSPPAGPRPPVGLGCGGRPACGPRQAESDRGRFLPLALKLEGPGVIDTYPVDIVQCR